MSVAKRHLHHNRDVNSDIAGIKIPDSKMARDLTQLIRDTEPDLLFHHSTRVYLFGALTGERKGLKFDPELLYVGAMFHDIGLTEAYRHSQLRCEVDGANAAQDFLRGYGVPQAAVEIVWDAIALHTTPVSRSTRSPRWRLLPRASRWTCSGSLMSSSLTPSATQWSRRTRGAATSRTISSRPSMTG